MPRLADLYASAALSPSTLRQLGTNTAVATSGRYLGAAYRRKTLLERAIAAGRVQPQSLGPKDRTLLQKPITQQLAELQANTPFKKSSGGGFLGLGKVASGVGGFLGHLGSDAWQTGKYLPAGLIHTGSTIAQDIIHRGDPLYHGPTVKSDILKPMEAQYSETYGHGPGHFFSQFYKHPLGPILDAATVASLGASGGARLGASMVARAAPESQAAEVGQRLVALTSREGRAPIHPPELRGEPGVTGLEREYTPRPLAKLGQIGLDRLANIGEASNNPLYRWQYKGALRKDIRESRATADAMGASMNSDVLRSLSPISKLSPAEFRAMYLTKSGVSHPDLIDEYERLVTDTTLSNPDKLRQLQKRGISPDYIHLNAKVTPEVRQLITHPTDAMKEASKAWDNYVERMHGSEMLGIDPEVHAARINQTQKMLLERMGWPEGEITPWLHGANADRFPTNPLEWNDLTKDTAGGRRASDRSPTFHAGTEQAAREISSHHMPNRLILRLYPKGLRNRIAYLMPRKDAKGEFITPPNPDLQQVDRLLADGGGKYSNVYGSGNHYWRVAEEMQAGTFGPRMQRELRALRNMREDLIAAGHDYTKDSRYQDKLREIRGELSVGHDIRRLREQGYTGVAYYNVGEDRGSASILGFNKGDWRTVLHEPPYEHGGRTGEPYPAFDPLAEHQTLPVNYMPVKGAEHFKPYRGLLARLRLRKPQAQGLEDYTYMAGPKGVRLNTVGDRVLYAPPPLRALHLSTGETFASGAARMDARALFEHAVETVNYIVEKAFNKEQVSQWAAKTPDGEEMRFTNQSQVNEVFGFDKNGNPNMMLTHDSVPISWFRAEMDHLQKVFDTMAEMENQGSDLMSPLAKEELLGKLTDADAKMFVSTMWGALKQKGVAVPRDVFEYQLKFARLGNEAYGPVGRFFGKWMHLWRSAVLTYMPRWAFNTAAGSFLMNMVRGVTPFDYIEANRLARTYIDPQTHEQVTRPSFLQRTLLRQPDIPTTGLEHAMPHGVTLAHQAELEVMDMASASYLNRVGIRFPTRKLLHGVQAIEDYFRRAMFIHNLRREQRLAVASRGGRTIDIPDAEVEAGAPTAHVEQPDYMAPPPDLEPPLPGEDATVPVAQSLPQNQEFLSHAGLSSQLQQELDNLTEQLHSAEPGSSEAQTLYAQVQDKQAELDAVHNQMAQLEPEYMSRHGYHAGPTPVDMIEDLQKNDHILIQGEPYTVGDSTSDGWIYLEQGHHPQYNYEGNTTGYTHQDMEELINNGVVEHVKAAPSTGQTTVSGQYDYISQIKPGHIINVDGEQFKVLKFENGKFYLQDDPPLLPMLHSLPAEMPASDMAELVSEGKVHHLDTFQPAFTAGEDVTRDNLQAVQPGDIVGITLHQDNAATKLVKVNEVHPNYLSIEEVDKPDQKYSVNPDQYQITHTGENKLPEKQPDPIHPEDTAPHTNHVDDTNLPPQQAAEHDQAMQEIGIVLRDHFDTVLKGFRGDVSAALQNPEVVRRALQETNKMMYNYMILGPFERQYVRQFIPFWGWYKFISMATWRLGVEMPGRVNIMRWLSQVGLEEEQQYGQIPDWLRGVIPLSSPKDKKHFKYLTTLGMNPFSQFFNPLSTETLAGAPSQLNPMIQAGLQAVGYDPLTGDRVRVSPESGVAEDFFGRLYRNGQQTSIPRVEPGWRFLGALLRSFPEYQKGESMLSHGGVYPEDVAFLHPRPMGSGTAPANVGQLGLSYVGTQPREYDLQKFQQTNAKSGAYARTKNLHDRARLKKKLRGR